MSIYKRGDVWHYYITHEGRRFRGSTGKSAKADAQRFHDELRAELWRQRRGGGTFHGALDAWANGREGPDGYRVDKLKESIPDRPLQDVTAEWLEPLLPATTPGTFNRYANMVTAAWNKARRKHDLPPLGLELRKVPRGRVRWLTAEEWKDLRGALPDNQRPMADFAIATGIRQANVFRLEWSQVDLGKRVAWIHPDQAKAGKPIRIPLNDDAVAVLRVQQKAREARAKGREWVFVGKDGAKPPTEIKTAWKTACAAAGIRNFTWHGLRHTWASWHAMAGTPLAVLKELGGWSDMRMVMRYAHLAESHVDQFAANAKPYQPGHISRHKAKKAA